MTERKDIEEKEPIEIWNNELTNVQRIAAAAVVFDAIWEHMKNGGTYRYLIYHRLHFNYDAYMPLMTGLNISNYIHDHNENLLQRENDRN